MENNSSKTWIWVIVIVVIVIILFVVFGRKSSTTPITEGTPTGDTALEPTESVQDTTGDAPGAVTISYANALVKYADRRIQLDKNCVARPNNVTYKDNTGIMIDNRSPLTRTIKVGTTFSIKPYGFKIVTLPDTYLKSKTLLVDCDNSQNVATILVQE